MPLETSLKRLKQLDQRPFLTFFTEDRMTDANVNIGLAGIATVAIIGAITGDGHPIVLVFAVVAGLILWRNFRRFRQRVRAALAENAAD